MAVGTDRRAPLNRHRVLRAAMQLADEEGVESLSMRKLGQALGVEAMSLYNHVANKGDLLDGIVDLVYGEIELPAVDGVWDEAIRAYALSARDAFVRHPWACNLLLTRFRPSAPRLESMESVLRCLSEAGFPAETIFHAYHVIESHILGFTLWAQGHNIDQAQAAQLAKEFFRHVDLENYPGLVQHIEQHYTPGKHKEIGAYEFGLRLMLEGLERLRVSGKSRG